MVFIDVKPNEKEGNNIVDEFLDQQWIDGKYLNIAYENFEHAPNNFCLFLKHRLYP